MTTFLIVTQHTVEYTYMLEAPTEEEARRQVLENEVEGKLTDEGDKEILSVEEGAQQ